MPGAEKLPAYYIYIFFWGDFMESRAAYSKTVYRDMIPYRAGIVRITPLDSSFNPILSQTYTTQRDFLTSTKRSTTFSYDTSYNINGEPSDYISNKRENLEVTTQIFDPRFDALVSNKSSIFSENPRLTDITIVLNPGKSEYTLSQFDKTPYDVDLIEIRDSYGNALRLNQALTNDNDFYYDASTRTFSFYPSESYRVFHCSYHCQEIIQEAYASNSIIKNSVFMLEAFGEMMIASNGVKQGYYTLIQRATINGDITGGTRKKGIDSPITYNFSATQVKRGASPCYESFFNL